MSVLLLLTADSIYKNVNNITFLNRDKCILYAILPKFWFLVYEYFFELAAIVFAGIFIAILLERWFSNFSRFYPKNPVTSFIYASLIPVCACTTIPLVQSMREKLPFRTIITFIVSAPLLNPVIIMLSFSVIGYEYAILRIVSAFILAVSAGFVVELFYSKDSIGELTLLETCRKKSCSIGQGDVYLVSYELFKVIFPYLLIAGGLGMAAEYIVPMKIIGEFNLSGNLAGIALIVLIGLPLYFCNGADVLLLRPLMHFGGLPLGSAVAFSLTSTAICLSSLVMLYKFLGKKLSILLVTHILLVSLLLGLVINTIHKWLEFSLYWSF
ncbi:MAG: permease [bacterium]